MRVYVAVACLGLLAACTHRLAAPPPPDPVIHRIALIPASNPHSYTLENAMPPTPVLVTPAFIAYKVSNKKKAARFNEAMARVPNTLGDQMTQRVARALEARGFVVEVVANVARPAQAPDDVEEDKVDASVDADAIVHIWISEVGIYAGHLSSTYLPRVNASGKLWIRRREESLWANDIYYGVDAKKEKQWAILPDANYHWDSFDGVMNDLDQVRASFSTGADLVAARLAEQIADAALASGSHPVPPSVAKR